MQTDRRRARCEMVEEIRSLGREYMRPMGLEADRTGMPPPADHPFYLLCARSGGLQSVLVSEGEDPDDPAALEWKPLRTMLVMEEAAYWDRGVALSLPGPGLGGSALNSAPAHRSRSNGSSRRSPTRRERTGLRWR